MRLTTLLILILLFPAFVKAQDSLPTYGDISALKDLKKVYVSSENEDSRKRIIKEITKYKGIEVVNSPDDAQFFIEYAELSREALPSGDFGKDRQQRTQMRAYMVDADKRKTILWSDNITRDTEHFMGMKMYDSGRGEGELTKKFIKAIKKVRGEK